MSATAVRGTRLHIVIFVSDLTGAAVQRADVLLAMPSSPDYSPIYEQAGLAGNVTAQLPNGTGGAGIGLLVAVNIASVSLITWAFG